MRVQEISGKDVHKDGAGARVAAGGSRGSRGVWGGFRGLQGGCRGGPEVLG